MIIQGSWAPLVVKFDREIASVPNLVITLWQDYDQKNSKLLKMWKNPTVNNDTALCPVTEQETASFPSTNLVMEAKGRDSRDNPLFWASFDIDVLRRRDKAINMTQITGV